MGRFPRRSRRRRAERADALDFYTQLDEVERGSPRDRRRDEEPFGERRRERNRRRQVRRAKENGQPPAWEEAG